MPVTLQSASLAPNKIGGSIRIKFSHEANLESSHTLTIHKDSKNKWHPEIAIDCNNCAHEDIQQLRTLLATTLIEAAGVIQSVECGQLKSIADMLK